MIQFKALEKLIVWSRSEVPNLEPGAFGEISHMCCNNSGAAGAAGTQIEAG
jgi:hypothetical protein